MEKVLSGDDKIRKAEEIYYRRKMGLPMSSSTLQAPEKKSHLASKILLELLLIVNVAVIILAVQNKDFIFTEEFLASTENYKTNLSKSIKSLFGIEEAESNEAEQTEESTDGEDTETTDTVEELVPNEEEASSISQMEQDVEEIKKSYSFIKPIEGTVTSLFGARESVYQNVSGYHTGVDIGADTGTTILASTSRKSNTCFK